MVALNMSQIKTETANTLNLPQHLQIPADITQKFTSFDMNHIPNISGLPPSSNNTLSNNNVNLSSISNIASLGNINNNNNNNNNNNHATDKFFNNLTIPPSIPANINATNANPINRDPINANTNTMANDLFGFYIE